jgi:hypothetical protein
LDLNSGVCILRFLDMVDYLCIAVNCARNS